MIRKNSVALVFALAIPTSGPVWAQRPVINPNGVVNAASFIPAPKEGHALAPGSIASVFGRNLAVATASADGLPLPTVLAGTSVLVDGRLAPLFFVSPGQINFQIPERTPVAFPFGDYSKAPVLVRTASGTSDPVMVDMFLAAPGVFTLDGSRCGRGAILNVKVDGTVSVNSPANTAAPGDVLEVFGTGLGPPVRSPELYRDGEAAPGIHFQFAGTAVIDGVTLSLYPVFFAGRAPGQVGVDQVNVPITPELRDGCNVPIRISSGISVETFSQPVLVSISRNGGQCVDPPVESFGEIVWQKEVVANASPPVETETFVASFPASPGRRMPPAEGSDNPMLGGDSYRAGLYTGPPPPSCPVPGYRQLDLGWLNLQTPQAEPIRVVASGESDQREYRATLPQGTIRPGRFRVSAGGGSGVAPFETDIQIGSDIQITSQFPPGFELRGDPRLTVTWTGGEPGTVVRVRLIAKGAFQAAYLEAQVPAPVGRASFPLVGNPRLLPLPALSSGHEIVVDVFPDPRSVPGFSASGLTLGGRHTWLYRHRFTGLR